MTILRKLSFFFFFISIQVGAAEICKIDFDKYKLQAPVDCVVCQNDIKIPSDAVESTVNPVINFVTEEKEQRSLVRKMKVYDHFLSSNDNATRCSNYKVLAREFSKEFQSHLANCEKGPDLIDKKKIICDWVLPKYNSKITDTFYAYWSEVTPSGQVKFKPGKTMVDIEIPIRAQEAWCRKVEKAYKNRIFLGCQTLKDWVLEFDTAKKISVAMKRDMQVSEEASSSTETESSRKKMFQNACKYFDTHSASTFTQNLYLECITN